MFNYALLFVIFICNLCISIP